MIDNDQIGHDDTTTKLAKKKLALDGLIYLAMVGVIGYTMDVRFTNPGRVCAGDFLKTPPVGDMG